MGLGVTVGGCDCGELWGSYGSVRAMGLHRTRGAMRQLWGSCGAYVGYLWGGGGGSGTLLLWGSCGSGCVSPRLVLVAPRLIALGTPVGLLVAAMGPVKGTVTAWPGEGDRGAGPCAPPVAFDLGDHNDFSQILNIKVGRCGGQRGWGVLRDTGRAR